MAQSSVNLARRRPTRCESLAISLVMLLFVVPLGTATAAEPATELSGSQAEAVATPARQFLTAHCIDCHQGPGAEAGLDLDALSMDLNDAETERRWVRIFDRVDQGEMPPPDAGEVDEKERASFTQAVGSWLWSFRNAQDRQLGRVRARRLTRREVERSLQDLLGIDIPLADQLPEDSDAAEFSTVADGQSISHFQLERHLAVVDVALDEAFRRALTAADRYERDFDAHGVARRPNRKRTREPEIINDRAVVWSSNLIFYGRIPATKAPEDGWYRFTVRASALKPPETGGVWTTVHSGLCVSSAPLLAWVDAFEATEQPREFEFEAWLPKGHMLEIRPGDATLKKARFAGGQVGSGEGEPQNVPGIALDRITMQRIHRGADDDDVRQLLFGDVRLQEESKGKEFRPVSKSPREDAVSLVEQFASRVFRRPVSADEIAGYLRMVEAALDEGDDFTSALRIGYRAVLCSPRFLYFTESPGELDDYAIATRLSYMLTGSTPDDRLLELAHAGSLKEEKILQQEVDRLLSADGGRRFVTDFAAEWLDLDQIDFTQPDRKLVPDFDPIVQHTMLEETQQYLTTMLEENLSVRYLIESDFTFLNSRLARYYGIDGVKGDSLERTPLRPEHRRGGVLTQGAILKVTANGTNTSPVIRGVWVSERLLGEPIPPPPTNVPAIEPDIRGATTIREMLAKHVAQDSCASCHVKIDPPGFALENYDPAGRWRDRYVQLVSGRRTQGAKIDASFVMPDGQPFQDITEFRALLARDSRKLARNVAEKLVVYGTGAPVSFADRTAVEKIVDQAAEEDYGFRSLVQAVIASPLFLTK